MALISMQDVCLGFGGPRVLENVNLNIERGEMVGVLGRNGAGKTSLLRLAYGDLLSDSGAVSRQQGLRVAYLPQEVPQGLAGSISEIVASGLISEGSTPGASDDSWQGQLQVEKVLSRMALDAAAPFEKLSAGMKRRVLLARALVREPDLLMLDEPTNHLDIDAIRWLEDFLARWNGTLLFVTHDRAFLQKLTTRIVELDRGRLFNWNCNYNAFIKRKEGVLDAEADQAVNFDKKLAQEEAWIRRGTEARRTRNEGRVRGLLRLRELRQQRREGPAKMRLIIQEARRTGRLVIEAEGITYAYPNRMVIRDFSTTLLRGDKVGIIGPNGSGKTTLLRILMGELPPQAGTLRNGTNLEVAYFDQLRGSLDDNKSAYENVGQGRDTITINGKPRNLISYMEDFLFTADRINDPVSILSGGERNRLLLARLFARPANVLVMDEPTNDLDIETLELLEDMLLDYQGTLLLVSHDRAFLNNLATSTLVLDGAGGVREYVGGYDDWLRQSQAEALAKPAEAPRKAAPQPRGESAPAGPKKLSYKEQRAAEALKSELDELPSRIDALETEQHQLTLAMSDPTFYQQDPGAIAQAASRLKALEDELVLAYQRWEELSSEG